MSALPVAVLPIINGWLERLFPDPAERQRQLDQLLRSLEQYEQSRASKFEATNASIFAAGWRPFIGWICGGALAYQYLIVPLVVWVSALLGHAMPRPPVFDDVLWQMMFGLLGIGGFRAFERSKTSPNNDHNVGTCKTD